MSGEKAVEEGRTASAGSSNGSGSDALWTWFGLDRASFLIMPRVLMHEMPDEWQGKMAALLEEYDAAFNRWPEGWGVRAQLTSNGKMIAAPKWLLNYRHPDQHAINSLRPNTSVRHEPKAVESKP